MAGSTEKKLGGSHKPKSKSKSKSKKKKIRGLHITPADNGGFVAQHDIEPDPDAEPGSPNPGETHALADNNALLQHVQDHFGGQLPQPGADQGAGGGAAAAGPAGPGGM